MGSRRPPSPPPPLLAASAPLPAGSRLHLFSVCAKLRRPSAILFARWEPRDVRRPPSFPLEADGSSLIAVSSPVRWKPREAAGLRLHLRPRPRLHYPREATSAFSPSAGSSLASILFAHRKLAFVSSPLEAAGSSLASISSSPLEAHPSFASGESLVSSSFPSLGPEGVGECPDCGQPGRGHPDHGRLGRMRLGHMHLDHECLDYEHPGREQPSHEHPGREQLGQECLGRMRLSCECLDLKQPDHEHPGHK